MIIDHTDNRYRLKRRSMGGGKHNGAYYYSRELTERIIPRVETDRSWVTLNLPPDGCVDHAIVFIHNNLAPQRYDWLSQYDDLVLVCGVPATVEKVKHLGHAIYLPLSVDVDFVKKFRRPEGERHGTAYVGRKAKLQYSTVALPRDVDYIHGLNRRELLEAMSKYEKVYAVGRTAIEAKILGCEVLPFDARYPDPSLWRVVDSTEAAGMLQKELDKIDKKRSDTE